MSKSKADFFNIGWNGVGYLCTAFPATIFPGKSFVFLTVCRFVPQKNLPLLVKSFFQVHSQNPEVRLLIVGEGADKAKIEKIINEQEICNKGVSCPIKIIPWASNVAGLMREADAYVLSSNYEGWARVLIEALCSSLPIVTTDVGCANEVVKNHHHGFVIPVNDKKSLVQAMLSMSRNKNQYDIFKKNIASLDVEKIPGVNLTEYGKAWVSTLG